MHFLQSDAHETTQRPNCTKARSRCSILSGQVFGVSVARSERVRCDLCGAADSGAFSPKPLEKDARETRHLQNVECYRHLLSFKID